MCSMLSSEQNASTSGRPIVPVAPVISNVCFISVLQNQATPVRAEPKVEQQQFVAVLQRPGVHRVTQIDEIVGGDQVPLCRDVAGRSEEHTSELQSRFG